MSEDLTIALGFAAGGVAYVAMEILAGYLGRPSGGGRRDARRNPTRTRRSAILGFYFAGGVSCLFTGRYLLGTLFVVTALAIRFASGLRDRG